MERLTDQTFEQAIRSSRPILVTFTAPKRCHECRKQDPVLEELAHELPVYIVDVEQTDTQGVEAAIGKRGVPFHKVYAKGQLLVEHLGRMTYEELGQLVDEGAEILAQMGARKTSNVSGMLSGFGNR